MTTTGPRSGRARRWTAVLGIAAGLVVGLTWGVRTIGGNPRPHPRPPVEPAGAPSTGTTSTTAPRPGAPVQNRCPCPNLTAGSNPTALPGAVLIADHLNNRLLIVAPNGSIAWEFPRPGDLATGQTFLVPDDAFFTPDGRDIVVTQEDDFVISVISVAEHRIVWRYGTPGVPGSGPNQLWNPDDAMMMPDGNIILADIKNCRVLVLGPDSGRPLQVYGSSGSGCWHQPPRHWGSPNGAFPMRNGEYLVTEINGDWVDGLTIGGQVTFVCSSSGRRLPVGQQRDPAVRLSHHRLFGSRSDRGVQPVREPAVALRSRRGRGDRPPVPGAAVAQRYHPVQRRLQSPGHRHQPAHQSHRLAVRPHRRARFAARLPQRSGRG